MSAIAEAIVDANVHPGAVMHKSDIVNALNRAGWRSEPLMPDDEIDRVYEVTALHVYADRVDVAVTEIGFLVRGRAVYEALEEYETFTLSMPVPDESGHTPDQRGFWEDSLTEMICERRRRPFAHAYLARAARNILTIEE